MWKHKNIVPILLVLGIISAILALFAVSSWWWVFLVLFAWLSITTWGSFDIRQGYFTDVFYKKQHESRRRVALTFDDGPTPITLEILALLKEHHAKATFFCIGKQINKHPDIFRKIIEEGHTIGNHTMNHGKGFGFFNADQVEQEIESCDASINDLVPCKPRFFRPPFGVTNPSVAQAVQETKHHVIGWSNRSLDTVIVDENKVFDRVSKRLVPGDIILFHDTSNRTLRVVARLLEYMQRESFESVTVDELLNLQAYEH